jgi:WD40 repeat protein
MVDAVPSASFASASNSRKNDLFISYSFKDIEFVKKLDTAIRGLGRNPWIDLEDLPYNMARTQAEERQYIEEGIDEADVFVFVISPDSLASELDLAELEFAGQRQKPIIPVVCRAVDDVTVPKWLHDRDSWILINLDDPQDPFEPLAARVTHVHIYERLRTRASEWERSGRDINLLLYKSDLESVKEWVEHNTALKLQLTPLQAEYYQASIAAETKHLLPRRPDVFISYSRRDKAFVEDLCRYLKRNNVNLWVDWENIPVASPWREELKEGIKNSDNFLFIMSSESVGSKYCRDEIGQAAEHKKRVITIVLRRDYDRKQVHEAVKERNWIYHDSYNSFDALLRNLLEVIRKDERYVRTHTNLLLQAIEWDEHKRNEESLLRGSKLRDAISWLSQGDDTEKEPKPTQLQREFIQASKKNRNRMRLVRWLAAGLATVGIVGSFLVTEIKTTGEIKALVNSLETKQELDALMVSLRAGRDLKNRILGDLLGWVDPGSQVQVVTALHKSIYGLNEHNRLEMHQGRVYRASFIGNDGWLASSGQDGTVRLWGQDGTPIKTPLVEHQEDVVALDFFPARQQLVSASYDGNVNLWQLARTPEGTPIGKLIQTLSGHAGRVYDVRFSPDGRWIASASQDGTVKIWAAAEATAQPVVTLVVDAPVYSISFSPNSKTLAAASSNGVRIWSGEKFAQMKALPETDPYVWVNFSPTGERLVTSGFDRTIKLWKADGTLVANLEGHEDSVYRTVFSHDGQVLASASADYTIRVWNAADGKPLRTLRGHQDEVYRVQFSPDNRMIASAGADDTVKLWKPSNRLTSGSLNTLEFWQQENDALWSDLQGHRNEILDIDFSKDGKMLASASADGSIRLWQTGNDSIVRLPHQRPISTVFSQAGNFLVSSGLQSLNFWRPDGTLLSTATVSDTNIRSISLNDRSNRLVSGDENGKVILWGLDWSDSQLKALPPQPNNASRQGEQAQQPIYSVQELRDPAIPGEKAHQKPVSSVSLSPDSQTIATAGEDATIKLWRLDGTLLNTLKAHKGVPTSVNFSPNGQLLVSASKEISVADSVGEIVIWDRAGRLIQTVTHFKDQQLGDVESVSFSPDGEWLAAADSRDNSIKLWRVVDANPDSFKIQPFRSSRGHSASILQLQYSNADNNSEGYLLASASQDGTVKLWKEGDLITTFSEHRREVVSVNFSPDGKMLASASYDRQVLLRPLPIGYSNKVLDDLIDESCQKLKDYIDANPLTNPAGELVRTQETRDFCQPRVEAMEAGTAQE